ncbi:transmembrane anchor protein [Blastomonas sp.]|uniref:transmembrane anchor protein n=1 Tax=Blastomonas sp. TaxID=1909299 RepID=UPI00359344ED
MGEIKVQLAKEAAFAEAAETEAAGQADAAAATPKANPAATPTQSVSPVQPEAEIQRRSDVTRLTLAPGQGAEIKLTAAKGARIDFDWAVEGGRVNYDTHADAPGISYHGYGKGRDSAGEQGELIAAFDGSHGWFWRNRSASPVTIILRTEGAYNGVKRVV